MAKAKDPIELDTMTCRKSSVIFRTNENVLKLLLWQDPLPVREDLHRLTELLEIAARIYYLPDLIRRLIRGLQERLMQVAEGKTYVEMIETFFQYKPMYHTCLNTYFSGATEYTVWKFYLQCCLEWRNNVITEGCLHRKYIPVDFMTNCPLYDDEGMGEDPDGENRLKAVAEYLTYFGSEGKKFLGKSARHYDSIDLLSKIRENRIKDEQEEKDRENPGKKERLLTSMSKKELHNKKDGVESRFNLHIILIPYQEDIITEAEFIERMERRKKNLHGYYSYSFDEDPTDIVNKAVKEHFAREFAHLIDLNGEQVFPYDPNTGELLYSTDKIEENIRYHRLKTKPKASLQTLEALSVARKGHKRFASSAVDSLFPDSHSTSTIAMRLTSEEFYEMFEKNGRRKKKEDRKREEDMEFGFCPEEIRREIRRVQEKPVEIRISTGDPKKGGGSRMAIEVKKGERTEDPNAIPRARIWTKFLGGFGIEDMCERTEKIVVISATEAELAQAAGALHTPAGIEAMKAMRIIDNGFVPDGVVPPVIDPVNKQFRDAKELIDAHYPQTKPTKEKEEKKVKKSKESTQDGSAKMEYDRRQALADWMKKKCYVCGETERTKHCARCRGVNYCSKECQVKDWPDHKYLCKLIRNERS